MFGRGEFEWDDDNISHIARHEVDPGEAEDAVRDTDRIHFRTRSGRIFVIGMTEAGRMLAVVLERKETDWSRVVTARDVIEKEKRAYRRRNR